MQYFTSIYSSSQCLTMAKPATAISLQAWPQTWLGLNGIDIEIPDLALASMMPLTSVHSENTEYGPEEAFRPLQVNVNALAGYSSRWL